MKPAIRLQQRPLSPHLQICRRQMTMANTDALVALRENGTIGDVIDRLKATRRPRLSDRVAGREEEIARLGPEPAEADHSGRRPVNPPPAPHHVSF